MTITPDLNPRDAEFALRFRRNDELEHGHRRSLSPIWMLPAIAIVALMWALIVVPGRLYPLTMIHFVSLRAGPGLGVVLLSIWWLTSHRLPIVQRAIGLAIVILTVAVAMYLSHASMKLPMAVYGLPTALTLLVVLLVLTRRQHWRHRRWVSYFGFAAFTLGSLLLRVGEMDAGFAFTLVPRWTPSQETELATELKPDGSWTNERMGAFQWQHEVMQYDWAEFRGPRRDGCLTGVAFDSDWDSNPPREIWRRAVGPGWSSFCVVGPVAFTQEQRKQQEAVVAYRVSDGELLWINSVRGRFEASMGGVGPRATPTFHNGHLYVTTATGLVRCLQAATGDTVWTYDLVGELDVTVPEWGFASSPLVTDETVFVFAGGKNNHGIVALDQNLGFVKWFGGDGSHSYCSPQLSTIEGQRQIVYSTSRGLYSLDLAAGATLWNHQWDLQGMPRVTQPLVVGNTVYLGTGYGNGTRRVDVKRTDDGWDVQDDWTASLKPYFNDLVFHEGHLYGFDNAIFTSIDAETGDRNWKGGRYGYGQVLLVKDMDMLMILSEKGKLVLLLAIPDRHVEVASIEALEGVTWNHPVIAGGKLFLRNGAEAVCYQLPSYRETDETQTDVTGG